MANEATLEYETEIPVPFTVADGTGIEKGTLLQLTDPMTASAQSAASQNLAGIAATEKISGDGVTKLAVYRKGIFKMALSGACSVGSALVSALEANYVKAAPASSSGAILLGTSLETGATGNTILVDVDIGKGGGV